MIPWTSFAITKPKFTAKRMSIRKITADPKFYLAVESPFIEAMAIMQILITKTIPSNATNQIKLIRFLKGLLKIR